MGKQKVVYGQGDPHTAELLKVSLAEAKEFKAQYFSSIPEARPFINSVHAVIKARGCVKNFYGRRRRLSTDDAYKAPNALIQGCAADYIKEKLVDMYKYLKWNNMNTCMISIVHDELVIAFNNDELDKVPTLRYLMSDFTKFRCNITAGVEYGNPSWGEKVEPTDVGFTEPEDFSYRNYNMFDGHVFDINKEGC